MLQPEAWPCAPWDGQLADGDVHIWLALLEGGETQPVPFATTLSRDEWERAGRLVFERDRRRFIAARVLLRRLLGRYLATDPRDVHFSYDRYGKPSVAGLPAPAFNLSHSGDAAVVAVSRAGDVGVDIEALRPMPDAEEIASRFFAADEVQALRSVPPRERERAFFACWTRKEAFVKAVGQGLSHPLDSFSVSLRPGEPVEVVRLAPTPADAAHWTLAELPTVAGYVGAVAVRGRPRAMHCRAWREDPQQSPLTLLTP